jgi:lysophospholipase L1-like esterase
MKRFALALAAFVGACASTDTVANGGQAPPPRLAPIPIDAPFRDEIVRFAEADRRNAPPSCPVLFVGSSSIRMWTSLARDMAPLPVLNRGFGGSTIAQVNLYFDRVVTPYRPRAIVFYAGENDIDAGQSPAAVAGQFSRFLDTKRNRLGDVPVFYISAKPSKLRFAQLARQSELNAAVRKLAGASRDLIYVDVASAMMKGGQPLDLFVEDGLHMAPAGYALWRGAVQRALLEKKIGQRRCRN